jgi:hypothetical protein
MSSAISLTIVEAILDLRHAFVASDHERSTVVVVKATCVLKLWNI